MQLQVSAASEQIRRPVRAGSASSDRAVMRSALRRVLDRFADDPTALQQAGYASVGQFRDEILALVGASDKELTPNLLRALFGPPPYRDPTLPPAPLGRLLGRE